MEASRHFQQFEPSPFDDPHIANPDAAEGDVDIQLRFFDRLENEANTCILEMGTRRIDGSPPTVRRALAHPTSKYIATDFQSGLDVDVVADAHKFSKCFPPDSFDMVLSCSVYEHLTRPWIVTNEIAKILKPGGWLFIQTHHAFPIHAFPNDYYRFSRQALETLCEDAGLVVQGSFFAFPALLLAPRIPGNHRDYLNVVVMAEKPRSKSFVDNAAATLSPFVRAIAGARMTSKVGKHLRAILRSPG